MLELVCGSWSPLVLVVVYLVSLDLDLCWYLSVVLGLHLYWVLSVALHYVSLDLHLCWILPAILALQNHHYL